MKKLNAFVFVVALGFMGFVSSAYAQVDAQANVDRCDGLVPTSLIQGESMSDMYFDMRLAELQCHYVNQDQAVLNKIAASIGGFKNKYAPCIKAGQDAMVADLASENTFDNFYAKLGNQIVLLNIPDPCGRALKLSQAMMKKTLSCGARLAAAYQPWFQALDKAYIAKQNEPLHRICDKTDN